MLIKINECQQVTNQPIIKRIKYSVINRLGKIRSLVKDVFEREEQNYLVIDGKKIKEKDLPNSVTGPSDLKGIKWGEIEYYPEDIEKMKNMNIDEILLYKKELIEKHQYLGGRFLE